MRSAFLVSEAPLCVILEPPKQAGPGSLSSGAQRTQLQRARAPRVSCVGRADPVTPDAALNTQKQLTSHSECYTPG